MKDKEPEFVDIESGSYGDKNDMFSFKWISMGHLKKCLDNASVEFRGGYWQTKLHSLGQGISRTEKFYVPDTREIYCNAIAALFDLTFPHFDKECIEETEEINNQLEQIRKGCLDKTEIKEKEILSNENYQGNDKITIEEYKFQKLRLYRQLFQKICKFLKRNGYFTSMGITDD